MTSSNALEEGAAVALDFNKLASIDPKNQVLPCAVQNVDTNEVILVAYVNQQALDRAIETRAAVFWSTSRNELWEKGKTSGATQALLRVDLDCDRDALKFTVRQ